MTAAEGEIIDEVIEREGGLVFTNDPHDPGGATFAGITLTTARRYFGPTFTVEDLRALTRPQIADLYYREFVVAPHFDRLIDPRLRLICVDYGVNAGAIRAVQALQVALGTVYVDGRLGPVTIAAANTYPSPPHLANAVAISRALYCTRLVQNDVNAFLVRFADFKRRYPDIAQACFPTPKDELDVAAFADGWVHRALSDVA